MHHDITKAGIARLLVDLGAAEIYVSPRISLVERNGNTYQHVSHDIVQATLASVDCMSVVSLEIDLTNVKVYIKTADTCTEVSSYHHNGTGPFFRDGDGVEFCELNNQDGKFRWFMKGHRNAEFTTPRGARTNMTNERISSLVDEVRSLTPRVESRI